jgi:hypothetical protein
VFTPEYLFTKVATPVMVIDPEVLSRMPSPLSAEDCERLPQVPLVIHAARIRLGGALDDRGRFIIGLVESDPPPERSPRHRWHIRTWGILQGGYYRIAMPIGPPGLSTEESKIAFARGKPRMQFESRLHPSSRRLTCGGVQTYWRIEFQGKPGRPEGRKTTPDQADKDALQKVNNAIKQWSAQENTERVMIKDVVQLLHGSINGSRIRELRKLFNLPHWGEYVRQILTRE